MAVNLVTNHYRFGVDELAENTHGWYAAEDANPASGTIQAGVTFLLRFNVQETGGTAAANTDNQFQCALNGGAFQNITTVSSICKAVAAAALTDAGNCTQRLSGTGTFESSGAGQTEDGLSGGNANDIAASGCSETECGLQLVAADCPAGSIITFRITSPDFTVTNNVVPTLKLSLVPSVNDSVTVTEGSESNGGLDVNIHLNAAVADEVTPITDSVTVSIVTPVAGLTMDINDSVTVTESTPVYLTAYIPTVSDDVSVTESVMPLLTTIVPTVSEDVTVSEAQTLLITELKIDTSDAVSLTESVIVLLTELKLDIFDAVTVVEDVSASIIGGGSNVLSIDVFDVVSVVDELTIRGKFKGVVCFGWELVDA